MMADDKGRYGFGGLCAGMATVRAVQLDGQASLATQVNLNGKDSFRVDLRIQPAGANATDGTTTPQKSSTPEPDMPVTGYSGWLLAGAGLLGALLLVSAGTRRVLAVRSRTRNRD